MVTVTRWTCNCATPSVQCIITLASKAEVLHTTPTLALTTSVYRICSLLPVSSIAFLMLILPMNLSKPAGAGKECWCGNETSTDNLANSTVQDQCSEPCVGNPNVQCGGACGLIVYNVSTLRQMKQNTLSTCASCPYVKGALADSVGATCKGGGTSHFQKRTFGQMIKTMQTTSNVSKGFARLASTWVMVLRMGIMQSSPNASVYSNVLGLNARVL